MRETNLATDAGWADYDGDGWLDLFVTTMSSVTANNRLYRNKGGGEFTDVTLKAGVRGEGFATGVAVADYDNDSFEDLFIAGEALPPTCPLHGQGARAPQRPQRF